MDEIKKSSCSFTWTVCYWENRETPFKFLKYFLRDGFHHVMCMRYIDNGEWLVFNPQLTHLGVEIWGELRVQKIAGDPGVTVHTYRSIETEEEVFRLLAPMTCVEAVKALLGIRKHSILTPYQLYKFLKGS